MKNFKIFFVCLFLMVIGTSCLVAQNESGQIRGIVTDKTSSDVLIGANVTLKGTSLGGATDIDGKYVINAVPAGSYTMKISYIGYRTKEMPIEVKGGAPLEINVTLTGEAIEGEEVVVTAQAKGQRDAINQQLSSNTITNVVSAERMHELPDASAAAAISRLPGVSLMNGDQVVIRGVQAKLNAVMINGIELPSTDMNNRSTGLGFISSNMLSGIEVIKTITPDMDANTIGGVVNLKLREAPSGFRTELFAQGSYNNQDRIADNYKSWLSISNRFFDDKFGVFIQGNMDRSNSGGESASVSYGSVHQNNEDWYYGQMTGASFSDGVNISSNSGGNLILDYVLPHGKIVIQNTYAHTISNNISFNLGIGFNSVTYTAPRNNSGKDMYINALQTEYFFGDVKAEFTLSHSYTRQYTYINYNPSFNNPWYDPFGYDAAGRVKIFDQATLTPDDIYNIGITPTNADSAELGGWITMNENAFNQHLYNTSLDITVPVSFSTDVSAKFKLGGKFYRTTRYNDVDNWFTGSSDPDTYDKVHNFIPGKYLTQNSGTRLMFGDIMDKNYLDQRGQYFLGGKYPFKYALNRDKYDEFMTLSRTGWTNPIHWANTWRDDFQGSEEFASGYIMGTFDIGTRIRIIGGGRFEHYNMSYKANFDYVTHSVYGDAKLYDTLNTVNRNDDNFFPNVQVRYKVTDWADIRAAYSTGISRPDYRSIVPSTYYEPGGGASAGNPNLKPATSTNFDIALSVYSNEIGLFTISPFWKKIENLFYSTGIYYKNLSSFNATFPDSSFFLKVGAQAPGASQSVTSNINNTNPGYISGVELDWQTNFWYLPKPLNALVLNVNYTKAWSDMAYNQITNTAVQYRDTTGPRPVYRNNYISKDTVYNARLLFQANDVVNITLGFDYKDFSARISFNMQGNIVTGLSNNANREGDQFTGNVYKWDFTIQQKLPIQGLSIMLSGVNILHNPRYTYQNFKRYGSTEHTQNLVSTSYSPSLFELTLRYSM